MWHGDKSMIAIMIKSKLRHKSVWSALFNWNAWRRKTRVYASFAPEPGLQHGVVMLAHPFRPSAWPIRLSCPQGYARRQRSGPKA